MIKVKDLFFSFAEKAFTLELLKKVAEV